MAINPSGSSGGAGSVVPTLLEQDPNQTYSNEYIKFMREYAKQMAQDKQKVYPYTWANGLADMSSKLFGAMMLRDTNSQERTALRNQGRDIKEHTAPGSGDVPGPTSSAGGPGGTAPPGPFRVAALDPAQVSPPGSGQQQPPARNGGAADPQRQTGPSSPDPRTGGSWGPSRQFKGPSPSQTDTASEPKGPNRQFPTTESGQVALSSDGAEGKYTPKYDTDLTSKFVDFYRGGGGSPKKDDAQPVQMAQAKGVGVGGGSPVGAKPSATPPTATPPEGGIEIPGSPYSNKLPQGQMQREMADFIAKMAGHGRLLSPEEAAGYLGIKQNLMPKYSVDPSGFIRVDEAGKPPALIPRQPGALNFHPAPEKMEGTPMTVQPEYDDKGNLLGRRLVPILPPRSPGLPTAPPSGITPSVPGGVGSPGTGSPRLSPGITSPGGVTPPPPQRPPQPPPSSGGLAGGPSAVPPTPGAVPPPLPPGLAGGATPQATPGAKPAPTPAPPQPPAPSPTMTDVGTAPGAPAGGKLAQAGPISLQEFQKQAADVSDKFIRLSQSPGSVKPASDREIRQLPTNSPPREVWLPYLQEGTQLPVPDPGKNIRPPSVTETNPDMVAAWGARQKIYQDAVTREYEESSKRWGKFSDDLRASDMQSRKQAPAIKQQLQMMDNAKALGLEQGPFSGTLTQLRSMRQQVGRIAEQFKQAGYSVPQGMVEWANMPGGEPNQIMAKNQAALTLENLRNMLGQNAGQFRVYELQLLEKALGGAELSPGAQKTVMSIVDRINDRNILFGQMARQWELSEGKLDPRFMEATAQFDLDHPSFTEAEFNKYMNENWDAQPSSIIPPGLIPPAGGQPTPGGAPATAPGWNRSPSGFQYREKK